MNAYSSGLAAFRVSYSISPIILVSGLAQNVPGGMIPIVSILQAQSYDLGLLSASTDVDLDDFFAQFTLLSGSTLRNNQVAEWPLANQAVAANAIINQPLTVSLLMVCPARDNVVTYDGKQAIISALVASLQQHEALGGWYNVATPGYVYQGCLLVQLADVSDGVEGAQVQTHYRWDFRQPLITLQQAQAAQNQAMAKISSGTQTSGDPPTGSVVANSVGQPSSNVAQNVVPAAASPVAANVSPVGG